MSMDPVREAFLAECGELLEELDARLLELEREGASEQVLNAVFRAVHTIKGGAGVVECRSIESFVHTLENVLDALRGGSFALSDPLLDLLFACVDQTRALLACMGNGREPDEALQARSLELDVALDAWLKPAPAEAGAEQPETAGYDCWHISVRFGPDVMRGGIDPLVLIRFLGELGELARVAMLTDAMPPLAEMDPEACYAGFEIDLRSRAGKDEIERVFAFVRDECTLTILPPFSEVEQFITLIMGLPEDNLRLGELLVSAGALTRAELLEGLAAQEGQRDAGAPDAAMPPLGEVLVERNVVQKALVDAALSKQSQVAEKRATESQLIRVSAEKLDRLINLVGELVIAGSSAALMAQRSRDPALCESTSSISRLVEEVRDSALRLRMVQIGEVFARFQRVVRDSAHDLGKDIELLIQGEETELDKSVVDKIGDPLMHLVRNAVDHGIEAPELRAARGKPARGRLRLNAFHESGSVVIEVSDDGNGLNRARILEKAVTRGLLPAGAELSDQEVYALVFEPGFSTAENVSSLSGRGVGMDVVKRSVEALRGMVEIDSREGEGTRVRIRLPLTLAIIDGFLMGVGGSAYVVPLELVEECIEYHAQQTDRHYLNLRGEVLPCIRLREFLEIGEANLRRENVVVVRYGGQRAGLVVDDLMGEFQTVIKPLGRLFSHLRGVAGSTILGGGEVALILDVPSLIALAVEREGKPFASALAV